jgi:Zn-dependent peptidase ImmA (M78 family)
MTTIHQIPRHWRHKSVRALIRSSGGGDPEEIIRGKAREVVAWAKQMGWTGPPYDPLKLASLRGIRSRKSESLFSTEAQLTPLADRQLLLEFNPDRAPCRKNYSISHEIVHTFFDDCYEMVHQRNSDRRSFDPEQEIEHLCQIGAAEILMPEEDFQRDMARYGFSLKAVAGLCREYSASREAVARRTLTLTDRPSALVFLSRRLKPIEMKAGPYLQGTGPREKMRVLYSQTKNFPIFIPQHKSAPDESCVYRVGAPDDVYTGYEYWEIAGFQRWSVEAVALPLPDNADSNSPSVMVLAKMDF